MLLPANKKIYFASDFHLGMYPLDDSREREKKIVEWLNRSEANMQELWLLGDIFDYWFEYKKVVQKGFVRFLGKLAELSDKGIPIHIITGNHDIWMFSYLEEEIGAVIHRENLITEIAGKTFYLGHGDGLNPMEKNYLRLIRIFKSRFLQWCYGNLIHPDASTSFAHNWSKRSRYGKAFSFPFKGEENESQINFAKKNSEEYPEVSYYIFGHRHLPYIRPLNEDTSIACTGDWISNYSWVTFDGENLKLEAL